MKRTLIAALLCGTSIAAHAENWQRVDMSFDGHIFEVDMDSIKQAGSGKTAKFAGGGLEYTMAFDCNGHYSTEFSPQSQHIPAGSILSEAAAMVCK